MYGAGSWDEALTGWGCGSGRPKIPVAGLVPLGHRALRAT